MNPTIPDLLLAPWINGVLVTAIRLNVFSILSGRKLTAEEIALDCESVPDRLTPLLDACISLGFLEMDNQKYKNSHFSRVYLVEGKQLYIGYFLQLINCESLQWFQLPDIIRGKEKVSVELPFSKPDSKIFISAMNCIGHLGEAAALKEYADLSGVKKMTDAGGGSGVYSLALCRKYP